MSAKIKILHLEDLDTDAELIEREIKRSGIEYEIQVVSSREDYELSIGQFEPDIVLSDHSVPSFDSIRALMTLKEKSPLTPFILVTATISEEFAVDVMRLGASDYVFKDRLQRLPNAINNSFEKRQLLLTQKKFLEDLIRNQDRLNEAQSIAGFGNWEIDFTTQEQTWSKELFHIYGIQEQDVVPSTELFLSFMHPDDLEFTKNEVQRVFDTLIPSSFDFRFIRNDGTLRYGHAIARFEFNEEKKPLRIYGVVIDITERKLAEEERDLMIADLIQKNRDLEQFAYIISHNLRAPTANILGITENLQDPELTQSERDLFIKDLSTSVTRLDMIIKDINDILQVKREINDKKEWINLTDLLNDIFILIKNLIDQHQVKLILDFTEINTIFSLRGYLHSVFYNLVSNSIKYRKPDIWPCIEINSKLINNKICIYYKDNGLGIDLNKNANKIFGLYKRFHDHVEGKGMGLFMVKTQIESLGGHIEVKSEMGKGLEYVLEFPQS